MYEVDGKDQLGQIADMLESIFDSSAMGVALLSADRRFLEVNRQLCDMTGYARSELLRMGPGDLDCPAERDREERRFHEIFRGDGRPETVEKRAIRKDGRTIWLRIIPHAVRDGNREIVGRVTIVEDITAQKETQQRLAERELLVTALVEAAPIALAIFNSRGDQILSNSHARELMLDFAPPPSGETRGVRWQGHDASGALLAVDELPLARALRGEKAVPGVEMKRETDDGASWFLVQAVPILDVVGAPNGAFLSAVNITDRKRITELLKDSRQVDRLMSVPGGLANVEARRSIRRLTPRETDVLRGLVNGFSNKEVARQLGLSPRTVEHHRNNLMNKLEMRRLPQLTALWMLANAC